MVGQRYKNKNLLSFNWNTYTVFQQWRLTSDNSRVKQRGYH